MEEARPAGSNTPLCSNRLPSLSAPPARPQRRCNRRILTAVFLGQLLSVFICGTAVSSEYLQRARVDTPVGQSLLNYLLLAFTFGAAAVYKMSAEGRLKLVLRRRAWMYALAALVDVEANFAIVKAYQFTSVTSVQLLDCLSIPTVLVLTLFLFGVRYRWSHYVGVLACLLGVAGMLLADYFSQRTSFAGSNPLLGDFLVVLGAVGYGSSNVAQEYLVRRYPTLDYLGLLGLFGSLIAGAQFLLLERHAAASALVLASRQPLIGLWFAMFAGCMYALYAAMPYVLARSSAVVVNLNLLTADLYALLVGLFLFSYRFHWLYFVAYTAIMCGVCLYVVREPRVVPEGSMESRSVGLWAKLLCWRRRRDEEEEEEEEEERPQG